MSFIKAEIHSDSSAVLRFMPKKANFGTFSAAKDPASSRRRRRCYLRSYAATHKAPRVHRAQARHTQACPRVSPCLMDQSDRWTTRPHRYTHARTRVVGDHWARVPLIRSRGAGCARCSSHSRFAGSHRPCYASPPPRPRDCLPFAAREGGVFNPASLAPRLRAGGR